MNAHSSRKSTNYSEPGALYWPINSVLLMQSTRGEAGFANHPNRVNLDQRDTPGIGSPQM